MRLAKHKDLKKPMPECGYHFRFPSYMFQNGKHKYDKDDLPIHLRVSPDKLINLCATVLNKQKMSESYTWSIDRVIAWLHSLGYPEYKETFRINLINGQRLLLLDTKTMLAMNIKDMKHIKHIYQSIHHLFNDVGFDSKYFRNMLFRLYRSRTGIIYENLRKTDFLIQNCINEALEDDWDILHKHLNSVNEKNYDILIGGVHRSRHGSVVVQLNEEETSESSILNESYDSLNDSEL